MNKLNIHRGGGSADVYCIFCGGPTYNRPVATNIKLFKKVCDITHNNIHSHNWIHNSAENIIKIIKKYNKQYIVDINEINQLLQSVVELKKHNWQNKILLLTKNGIIKNVKSNGEMYVEKNHIIYDVNIDNLNYLVHNDCYKLLETKYGKFTYYNIDEKIFKINYGIIKKYQIQYFDSAMAYLENPYLLESPLKNNKNKERILNLKLPIIKYSNDPTIKQVIQ